VTALYGDSRMQRPYNEHVRVRVEQHIALGHRATIIAARLSLDIDTVHQIWDDLDATALDNSPVLGQQERHATQEAPCGTRTAFQRHIRRREPIDPACRQADNTYRAAWARARRNPNPHPDPVVVERLTRGEHVPTATPTEIDQAIDILEGMGVGAADIAARVGLTQRTITRRRARHALGGAA
jgi:hypothetical protein